MGPDMLQIADLNSWYGQSHILQGVNIEVEEGEVVTLLGRNGAGKTTTLKSIMGLAGRTTGSIRFRGQEIRNIRPDLIARRGIGFCPEERGIFASLTVKENLGLAPVVAEGGLTQDEIFTLFPNLEERLESGGKKLSGGEQQMLALARILRTGAKLLLLDEPTEGLAPAIIQQIGRTIHAIKARGFTILLVEQNVGFATSVADRHYVMEQGKIEQVISNEEAKSNLDRLHQFLSV
ncbi:ABC transporter ATP-binding protein (plasmid) [Mesorhizobium sp. ORM8.1]